MQYGHALSCPVSGWVSDRGGREALGGVQPAVDPSPPGAPKARSRRCHQRQCLRWRTERHLREPALDHLGRSARAGLAGPRTRQARSLGSVPHQPTRLHPSGLAARGTARPSTPRSRASPAATRSSATSTTDVHDPPRPRSQVSTNQGSPRPVTTAYGLSDLGITVRTPTAARPRIDCGIQRALRHADRVGHTTIWGTASSAPRRRPRRRRWSP